MNIKGALHLHSEYSYDAKLSLEELRSIFLREGLSFALMTEHTDKLDENRACDFIEACERVSTKDFLFIPGFEVPYKNTHVLMVGAASFVASLGDADTLGRWREQSALAILAHPHRNHYRVDDVLRAILDGIEVWNSQYDSKYVPRARSMKLFTQLHALKPQLNAFAGWDFHREEHRGGPVIELSVSKLSKETICEALLGGSYRLRGRVATLSAQGKYIKGSSSFTFLCSPVSVFFVAFGKQVNRGLRVFGIRPPAVLRKIIRRWL